MAIVDIKVLGIANTEELSKTEIPRNHHTIRFEDLTDEEYDICDKTTGNAHVLLGDVQLFVIAEWNYQEYCDTVSYYQNVDFQEIQTGVKSRTLILDINRSLLNFLSAVRMYLDHTETSIKRRYGRDSQNIEKFKISCSKAYDSSFSYRFLYKLRNYTQHCGLPINSFSATQREHDFKPGEPYHELQFGLNRNEVLNDFDWGAQLRQDILLQPEIIQVDSHVHEFMQYIRAINYSFAVEELQMLSEGAKYISDIAHKKGLSPSDKEVGVYILTVEKDDTDQIKKILRFRGSRIPIDVINAAINKDPSEILSIQPITAM